MKSNVLIVHGGGKKMKLQFEYGQGFIEADLPDKNTDIFIPGETVPNPELIPQEQLEEVTRQSILNPIGVKPILE